MTDGDIRRILLVTRNMPPLWGGMEQLNWHMVDELSRRASVSVVAPRGSRRTMVANVEVSEVALQPLSRFFLSALAKTSNAAFRQRPELVLAGSGLTAPLAWLAARISRAKCATYIHGLDIAVANKLYRWLWIPALRRMDVVIANSHATATLARQAGIESKRIKVVHPGVTTPGRRADEKALHDLRERNKWGGRRLLLSVGRLTSRKGLREFVAEVLPGIVKRCPDVLLVVVGGAPTQSLHAQVQTVESIQAAAALAGVAENIQFLGVITDRDRLAAIYEAADVHVFPVRVIPNDPEGFGMVAIEAAAHGLATVAYAAGGVVDAVAEGVSGCLLPPGESVAFADAVIGLLNKPLPEDGIRSFAARFDWCRFGDDMAQALFGRPSP